MLTMVTSINSIRESTPQSNTLNSLDYYLLGCLIFAFMALAEVAVVGITDFRSPSRYKREMKEKSRSRSDEFLKLDSGMADDDQIESVSDTQSIISIELVHNA